MIDTEKEVAREFGGNIETISSDFVAAFELRHKKEVVRLSDSFFRWIDFRLRYIDPKPRTVHLSKKLHRLLPASIKRSLHHLFYMIQNGYDINPYQGKGLIRHHDTSGRSRCNRTDLLWADWGVIHLHLTCKPIPRGKYFCDPSDWLLFAMVGDDFVACIDVRPHKETNIFSNPELIQIVGESWPELIERFKMRGLHAPDAPLTAEEHKLLRRKGQTGFIVIGEDLYMGPGMGISTASTSTRVIMCMDNIIGYVRELAGFVCNPDSQFQDETKKSACNEANFRLCITPLGLAVYEANMDKAWVLPRREQSDERSDFADLHDLFAPEWAIKKLLEKCNKREKIGMGLFP